MLSAIDGREAVRLSLKNSSIPLNMRRDLFLTSRKDRLHHNTIEMWRVCKDSQLASSEYFFEVQAGSTFTRAPCGSESLGRAYLEYDGGISDHTIVQRWCSVDTLETAIHVRKAWPSDYEILNSGSLPTTSPEISTDLDSGHWERPTLSDRLPIIIEGGEELVDSLPSNRERTHLSASNAQIRR
jgi:hypothetical protein